MTGDIINPEMSEPSAPPAPSNTQKSSKNVSPPKSRDMVKQVTARIYISKDDPNAQFQVMLDPTNNSVSDWITRIKKGSFNKSVKKGGKKKKRKNKTKKKRKSKKKKKKNKKRKSKKRKLKKKTK